MDVIRLSCCGIIEINGLCDQQTAETLGVLLNECFWGIDEILHACAWVIFSQSRNGNRRYGDQFAEWLEANHLGSIIRLPTTLNHNSGNSIDVFMWQVDHAALELWMTKNWKHPDDT